MSDVKLRVLTTDTAGPSRHDTIAADDFPIIYLEKYEVFFCRRLFFNTFSPGLLLRLWPMIRCADVVHLTAVYSSPTIPTLLISRILDKPIIWSSRGALQRWERSTKPFAKKLWELICDFLITPEKCILHVTSEQEAIASKQRITNSDTRIIPNGVEIPEKLPARTWQPDGRLRLLYLGRLHPKKGIENLLQALKQLESDHISLDIYGTGNAHYCNSLHELVRNLGLSGSVCFKGELDSEDKLTAFISSDICVIPSFTENFGMVIAESLAHGVPVITSTGTPWKKLEEKQCGLFVDNDPDTLAISIQRLTLEDLEKMGKRGRVWMQEEYNWQSIGEQMFKLYKTMPFQ